MLLYPVAYSIPWAGYAWAGILAIMYGGGGRVVRYPNFWGG